MDLPTQKNPGGVSPNDTQSTPNQNLTPPSISQPEQTLNPPPPLQPNRPVQPPISSAANLENTLANQESALKPTQPAPPQVPPFVTSAPPPPSGIDLTTGKVPPTGGLTQPPAPTQPNDPPFFGQPPITPPPKIPASPAAAATPTAVYANDNVPLNPPGHLLRNTFLTFFALFLITASVLSCGLYAAYTNYIILPLPQVTRPVFDKLLLASPIPKPDRLILDQMFNVMAKTKTAHHDSNLEIDVKNASQDYKVAFAMAGPLDFQQQEVKRSEAHASAKIEMEGLSFSFTGDVKTIGSDFYFQITEFPGSGFLDPGQFKNQWFVIHPNEEMKKQVQAQDFKFDKTSQVVKDEFSKINEWSKSFDDQKDTYHFRLSPPQSLLKSITDSFYQEMIEQAGKDNLETQTKTDQDLQEFKKILDNINNNLIFDLFINKTSYRLEKLESRSNFTLDMPSTLPSSPISTLQVERPKVILKLTSTLSDFDQKIVIDIPKDAKDFEEVTKEFTTETPSSLLPETLKPSPVLGWRIQRDWNPKLSDLFKNLFAQPKN